MNSMNWLISVFKELFATPEVVASPKMIQTDREWDSTAREATIPGSRDAAITLYGNPGVGKVDPVWARANMVVSKNLPGKKSKLYVHKLAEPYLREALARCQDLGVLDYITTLGCFNFRHQRHDVRRPLSYHAFGVALDINPKDNRGIYRTKQAVPYPFTAGWSDIYPKGVPEDLVRAFESVGWVWGGRWSGSFVDPMHFQLVK